MKHSNNNEKYFFEIHKDYDGLFYFQLKDYEDNIYLDIGNYTQKTKCEKEVKGIIYNSKNEYHFKLWSIYDGKWIILLKKGNGLTRVITDEFDTREKAENVIEDLRHLSLKTPVIDKTK
ncbi:MULTISPECIES: hypothetical protein [unclassified Apibacter]|uniref:hypothetical protein n=1 Tax=unclassified Apibacter TaxID=2630820 RepID=UPI0013267F64|nr:MULTISPECIES: hypothetical protein [unclassified Apibacter]MCX8676252.1 hypothetical protein [Apibacter sp. B3919]MXO23719.1 hypothetical protein [Apibacter sp. B3924]MXO26603.1 hypothetical protein [Apibacter sp. B3813]MXO29470.1 hypothetical protein [Apibacter sp. B3913]MXO31422.1 hypothetical protein [Apibacter sp. B3912]